MGWRQGSGSINMASPTIRIPPLSLLFGYGAMFPLVGAAGAIWLLPLRWDGWLVQAALIWAAAILAFLAGVRRGLSFRTAGGPTDAQLLTMLWLFLLAVASLLVPWAAARVLLLVIGYASIALLDPEAAQHGEVPDFFARLRPSQMLLPIGSLLVVGLFVLGFR